MLFVLVLCFECVVFVDLLVDVCCNCELVGWYVYYGIGWYFVYLWGLWFGLCVVGVVLLLV